MHQQAPQQKTTKKNILLIHQPKQYIHSPTHQHPNKFTFRQNITKINQIQQKNIKTQQTHQNHTKDFNPSNFSVVIPQHSDSTKSINQHQLIVNTLIHLNQQLANLSNRVQGLQSKLSSMQNSNPESRKKKLRRKAQEIQKNFTCPYDNCSKTYGSEVSLNLHIKLKHNGGTKTERQQYIKSKMAGEDVKTKFSLPPKILKNIQEQYQELHSKNTHSN